MSPDLTLPAGVIDARRPGRQLALGVVFSLLLLFLLPLGAGCGGKEGRRDSDLPYVPVDKAFQPLRRDFEDAGGKVRLVGLVSPTCGDCIDMADALDARLLPAIPNEDFEVFLVWVKATAPDVEPRVRELSEKYANPRIRHYWDGSGRIARAFARHVGLTEGTHAYAIFYLYGRGDTWDPQGTMARDPADYNAVLDGWQPSDPRARQGAHPMIRLPQLNVDTMKPLVEGLLAEPDPQAKPH